MVKHGSVSPELALDELRQCGGENGEAGRTHEHQAPEINLDDCLRPAQTEQWGEIAEKALDLGHWIARREADADVTWRRHTPISAGPRSTTSLPLGNEQRIERCRILLTLARDQVPVRIGHVRR